LTIKAEVRARVIQMSENGFGRNAIAQELKLANIKCSSGSISSILKKWKEDRSKNSSNPATAATANAVTSQDSQSQQSSANSNILSNMNNTGSLDLNDSYGTRLADSSNFSNIPSGGKQSRDLEEKIRQKENDIIVLDAESAWLKDRIDQGYRMIEMYKSIANTFSKVKEEMKDYGITRPSDLLNLKRVVLINRDTIAEKSFRR
jgi:hypothetical protein